MTNRERNIARGRVEVLQRACRQTVGRLHKRRDELTRLYPVPVEPTDACLVRAIDALLEAIDELVVVDQALAKLEVRDAA